jgi:hypothetical protein
MGRVFVLAAFAVAAACWCTAADAGSSKVVELPMGGTLLLAGSHVTCGSGHLNGETFIDCGIIGVHGQPKVGSYVVLMAGDGKVGVSTASTHKIVFNRAPAARARPADDITARPGDVIVLPTLQKISCDVRSLTGVTTIFCYYVDRKGIVKPGSYSFGLSDVVTTTLAWYSPSKSKLVGHWPENG